MKLNLIKETERDIELIKKSLLKLGGVKDKSCLEFTTPFEVHPDAMNLEFKKVVAVNMYPEILTYYSNNKMIVEAWVCCRFGISMLNEKEDRYTLRIENILSFMAKQVRENKIKPFYDEDAVKGIFSHPKVDKKWMYFKFYMNPDYKNGARSNHALG